MPLGPRLVWGRGWFRLVVSGGAQVGQERATGIQTKEQDKLSGLEMPGVLEVLGLIAGEKRYPKDISLKRKIMQVSMVAHNFIPVLERPRQTDFCEATVSVHNGFQAYRSI